MEQNQLGLDLRVHGTVDSLTSLENRFSTWYTSKYGIDAAITSHEVFAEALAQFSSELTKDQEKVKWIMDVKYGNVDEVLATIQSAQANYAKRRDGSQARESLTQLSEKLMFYTGVMDVIVNQHPEYTALAWGAMKFLLIGVVNHQKLVCRLSGGLCEVADILPRAELILQLYPTPHVRRTIVSLYAHIVRFLIRALRWYKDSTTRHMIHAITRPVELRYDDLLDLITVQARGLTELASASSHAEQRDMHSTIQRQTRYHKETQKSIEQLTALVLQMKEAMATEHVINASARIELRQRLSEMQLVQFMEQISVDVLPEPIKSFQASLFMRGRSRLGPSTKSPSFWLDPKIQWWNQSRDSSLIIIKGTWKLRLHLRGFCADIIASLQGNSVPVIWALNSIDFVQTSVKDAVSSVELIKYLIAQVVLINTTVHVDAALVPGLGMYMSARTASEWMNVLASLLSGIPRLYMVIDVEVLHPSAAASSQNFWSSAFHDIFADLRARQIETVLKVVMVSYGSPLLGEMYDTKWRHIVVSVGGARKSKALNNRRPKALGKKTLNLVRRSRGPQRFNSIKFGLCLDL